MKRFGCVLPLCLLAFCLPWLLSMRRLLPPSVTPMSRRRSQFYRWLPVPGRRASPRGQDPRSVNLECRARYFRTAKRCYWFEGNFSSQHVAQLSQDYPKVRDGHLGTFRGCLAVTSMQPDSQSKWNLLRCLPLRRMQASNPFFPVPCFPSLSRIFA